MHNGVWQSFEAMLADIKARSDAERDSLLARRDHRANEEHVTRETVEQIELHRKSSDLGERFAARTLASYHVPPGDGSAKTAVISALEDPERGFWLYGPPGTGKTHLAAGYMLACMEQNIPACFTTAIGLLDRLKASYDKNNRLRGGEYDVIDQLSRVRILVLDDLDKVEFARDKSKWAAQRIYALINRRYEHRRPLIVTSNITPAELALEWRNAGLDQLIGGAIIDRIREMCSQFIRVDGMSYRGLRRAQ